MTISEFAKMHRLNIAEIICAIRKKFDLCVNINEEPNSEIYEYLLDFLKIKNPTAKGVNGKKSKKPHLLDPMNGCAPTEKKRTGKAIRNENKKLRIGKNLKIGGLRTEIGPRGDWDAAIIPGNKKGVGKRGHRKLKGI
jgi:hypothetical protein